MARTVDFLPEIFRTPTNKQVLHATLDQLVQEPRYERAQGFIGQKFGPGVTTEDRYIVEPDKTRRDYQLEPTTIFLEEGSRRVVDALTYPGYLDALKKLNGPVTRPDELFEQEYYAVDFFIDWDKSVNYNQYYWVFQGPETVRLTAPATLQAFDVEREIVGQQTYTTDNVRLVSPVTWNNTVAFSNGMRIQFIGNIKPAQYRGQEFYIEGVGTAEGIKLLPVDNFVIPEIYNFPVTVKREPIPWDVYPWDTTQWDGSRLVPGSDIDYVTINRASQDLNPWTRSNRWFHIDVLTYSAEINGQVAVVDDNFRGKRPILEFRPNIKLIRFGTQGLQPISLIDYSVTNAFTQVAGQPSFTIDGIELFAGMKVIFAADENPEVARQVYLVQQITPVPGGQSLLYLEAIEGQVAAEGSVTVCTLGQSQQGYSFYYSNGQWSTIQQTQQKTHPNQAPLFDVFDSQGISFSNATIYPDTTFVGSPLFSYAVGEGVADAILKFPLQYSSLNNVGDILFFFNFYRDSFTYLNNLVTDTVGLRTGYVHQYTTRVLYDRLIGYQTASLTPNTTDVPVLSQQPQIFEFNYTSGSIKIDVAVLEQDQYPNITDIIKVSVNDVLQDPNTYSYKILDGSNLEVYPTAQAGAGPGVQTEITFDVDPDPTSLIVVAALSTQTSTTGYFAVPTNLTVNALNENITQCTLGTLRDHYVSICQNIQGFQGQVLAANNSRDLGNLVPYGTDLIQHSAPLAIPAVFLREQDYSLVNALDYSSIEYQRYKDLLLDFVWKNEFINETTAEILDSAIDALKSNRSSDNPFYWSDCITAGIFDTTSYTWYEESSTSFDLIYTYDFSQANYQGLNVYVDDVILCRDRDYVVDTITNTVTVELSVLTDGCTVVIREYQQTYGNFVPATPSSLRLYPAYFPEIYLDTTYITPAMMIRGHDGSLTPAFGDYRDQVLLEFETRIYSNIKGTADYPLDYNEFLPGAFRGVTQDNINSQNILNNEFVRWLGSNRVDYKQQDYLATNEKTWNYSQTGAKITYPQGLDQGDAIAMPGYWRQIYWLFYDTDEPQNFPWQMLGFTNQPIWWTSTYGPAPYTSGNQYMWQDIAMGRIREPGNVRIDPVYARPGLLDVLPVDAQGNLVLPFAAVVADYNPATWQANWSIGGGSPAESAWRKSSAWPFAIQKLLFLLKPAQYLNYYVDRDQYKFNTEFQQWLYDNRQRLTPGDVQIYGDGTAVNSYVNFIIDYNKSYGLPGTANLESRINNIDIRLAYRVAGFTDKRYLQLLSDRSSPNTYNRSLLIPDENYNILLYRNEVFDSINYSAVTIERTESGWAVYGNSIANPYFQILPSIINNNYTTVRIGNTTIRMQKDFSDQVVLIPYGYIFRSINAVVDFLLSYGQYLNSSGFGYNTLENTVLLTWEQMAQEFVYWYNQGWAVGSLIQLNPSSSKLEFRRQNAVVVNLLEAKREDILVNQNKQALRIRDYSVYRDGNLFELTSLNENNIGYVNLKLTSYEHIIVIDNITDFDDLIYQPLTGLRQGRLIYQGIKSAEWNGTMDAPGFIINLPSVAEWDSGLKYAKGQVVKFKNFYYQANTTVDPAASFDYNLWDKIVYRPDQEGMLPNLALKAIQSTQFYDQHADNLDADSELLGFGLTGFRPREYMASIELDTVSQMNAYQDFIGTKGTPRSLYFYDQAVVSGDELSYDVYENWAIQRATYGATATNAFVDFTLDATKLTSNPSTSQFVVLGESTEADQATLITDLYAVSQPINTTQILPQLNQVYPDKFLPTAGYVDSRDVEIQLFSIADLNSLTAELDKVTNLAEVWIAKINESDWNVYKCQSLPSTLVLAQDNLDGQTLLIFSGNHGLSAGQTIIIKEFNIELQGAFVVSSVPSTSTVLIASQLPDGVTTLVGEGVVFELSTVRVAQPSDIADLAIQYDLSATNKVWVDNNGQGRWQVLEKQSTYTSSKDYEYAGSELFGSAVCQTSDDANILIGAPGSYTSGVVIPYYLDGNVYVAESPISIPSTWTNYSDFGRVGDASSNIWAAFSTGIGTVPGFNTDFRVVLMQKTDQGFEPRQLLPGGSTGVAGYFTGSIKFSADAYWLYVSNPVDRKVQIYQRNRYQEQETEFACDGVQTIFDMASTVRVDRGAQFAVTLNSTLQAYNQDYTANPTRISLRLPPAGPTTQSIASITSGTNTLSVNTTTNLAVGQAVSGLGIPVGTKIAAINTATNVVTLDSNVMLTATNVDITFTNKLYVSRWSTSPDSGYWGFGANPLRPNGVTRSFPIDMLAGATPDPESVGVYYNNQLMRFNNSPAVDGDYIYDYVNRRIVFNFTPPATSSQAVSYVSKDYFTAVNDIVNHAGDTFGISCATDGDGSVLAVGDADANSSNLGNDQDGLAYVYDRGSVTHKVSDVSTRLYYTPIPIIGQPQVRLNGQLLYADTETTFGDYVYETDSSEPDYTGNTAVRFNTGVIGNIGDMIDISYNKMTVTQIVTNPQANIGYSEFGGAVSLNAGGSTLLVGAPNGNTSVLGSGFVARIEDQAAVYGTITGNINNPVVTAGSSLRINNYFVEFSPANITSVSLSNVCTITTSTPHGFYNGETVVIENLNGGVLNLNDKPYYVRVTGSTTFNIFDYGTVSNVTASSTVTVTSNVAANIDLGLAIQVFNPVEISGVQGIANVNNTANNPYWLARKANGNSTTQFEVFRGVPIYNIIGATEGNVDQTLVLAAANPFITRGTALVLESNAAINVNNTVLYAGNIGIYTDSGSGSSYNSFILYTDPALIFPVQSAGNTGAGGTIGIFVDGTGWGNYVSGGQVLRIIDTNGLTPPYDANTTQGTAFDGSLDGVVNIINDQNITNVAAANAAGKLQLSVINANAAIPNRLLSVLPGTENSYDTGAMYELGLYPYYGAGAQIVTGSYPEYGSRFGFRIDQDWITNQVVISSEFGTAATETTFDEDTTTFDSRTTRFDDLYAKSGSVDVYDLLPSANPSRDNPSQLVWDQQLVDYLVRAGQNFGYSVSILGNNIVVGSPGYQVDNVMQGRALVFSGRRTGWKNLRLQPDEVDAHLLNEVTIYNKESKITLNYLDFIDPIQGRILGAAQQNIDLISATDPAGYNVGDVNNIGVNWGESQYGYIWWDINSVRFLEYHLQDINQAAKIWGSTFPGSSIDIYQWIESTVPPADYTGPGTPRSLTSYSAYDVITDTNSIATKYYFWVSGLEGVPPYTNKTLSCAAIAQYIFNPRSSGISYLAAINPSTVAIYNSESDFVAQDNVLSISYDTEPQQNNIHVEYDLIQQDNPRQFMDDTTYAKFVDSLSGIDALGNTVPDPNLPLGMLYGINFNPRQSMFRDRFLALKNYITRTNEILLTFPFVEDSNMDLLNSQELPPKQGETDADGQLWWNLQVSNLTELGYQNISLVPVGYRYLVDADSRYNNFWTIHQVTVDSAGARTTTVIRVQTYKTPQYWTYVNWYAEGFDPLQRPLFSVEYLSQAQLTPLPENGVIKVTRNNPIGYELYQNKVIDSYRDPATLEWVTVTEFTRVALENGTIQISDQLYDYSRLTNPDIQPRLETRYIVDSINFEILTESRLILRNQLMSLMFNFILGEQIDCNWLYKTSLIDITHPVRKLLPYRTFKRDNQDFVYGYIEEVKPYHVFIKDFSLVYATVADLYPGDVTDFDVPATYNANDGIYISPILENDPDYVNYDKYGIYGVGPYAQFEAYVTAADGSGLTVLTVTEMLKGSIYVGANLVGSIIQPRTQIVSFIGYNGQGQATYAITGQYDSSTAVGTVEINPIWATLPYRNWYNNYGVYIVDIMVTNPGSGYTVPPVITINGTTADPTRATAILDGNGSITSILLNYPGGRYLTQPTVTIAAPDQESGTQATAYPVTSSGPVRSFDASLVYNRMNLRPSFTEWIPGFVYREGELAKFSGAVYRSRFDYNQNTQFDFDHWTVVPPGELEGVDRTYGYYTGAPGQPGLILDQLITGLTYPGVITGRRYLGTWDTGPWSTDPFESDRGRVETIINGGAFPLDSSTGIIPALNAWDVNVYGGEYVDTYSSHAPEELVPGAVFDTLDLTVYTIPGQDNTGAGFSSPLNGRIFNGDGINDTFSFQLLIKFTEQVLVFKKYGNGNKLRLQETVDYVIDWQLQTIQLTATPSINEQIMIIAVGLGGGNQLLRFSEVYTNGLSANGNIDVPIQYTQVWSLPVFVNGTALTQGTDYTIAAYRPEEPLPDDNDIYPITRINFANAVSANSRIDYTVIGERYQTTSYSYSLPVVEYYTGNSSSNVFAVTNTLEGTNAIAAVVENNGSRLRGPHCIEYIADGVTKTYAAGWQRDVAPNSIAYEDISVYLNDNQVTGAIWTSGYTEITDTYDITFGDAPAAGTRIVIAVWTAAQYWIDVNSANLHVLSSALSASNSNIGLTTWQETAEQNFLNTVSLGQTIIPVTPELSITTNGRWAAGNNFITVGTDTSGFWNKQGLWFDYAAFGSGIDIGNTNPYPNGTSNSANASVPAEMLSYGNVLVVLDGQYINEGDLVSGAGVSYGTKVTQVKEFKNRDLQTNWAVAVDRPLPANGLIWNRQYSNLTSPYLQTTLSGLSTGPNIVAVDDNNNILMSNNASQWTYIDPVALLPLRSVAYGVVGGSGYYIAVGLDSNILRSSDGINWTQEGFALPLNTYAFNAVAYGAGKFVIVGDDGAVFTSADVVNWVLESSGTTENLTAVSYDGAEFIAVGENAMMLASGDGSVWVRRYLGYVSSVDITDVGNRYIEPPVVIFEGPFNGTGITTEGFAAIEGGVGRIDITNSGALYGRPPNVVISQSNIGTFSGNTPSGATANAYLTLTGPVTYIGLVNGGSGYNTAPVIGFVDTIGGSNASAVATLNANGNITSIALVSGGSGYSTAFGDIQVTITPVGNDVPSIAANAVAVVTGNLNLLQMTAYGANYSSYDTITGSNSTPTVSLTPYTVAGYSNSLTTGNAFQSYITLDSVAQLQVGMNIEFTDNSNNQVYIGNITTIYPGNTSIGVTPPLYYTITPFTSFAARDNGINAAAVFGEYYDAGVQGIVITERGSGYDVPPNIYVGYPPVGYNVGNATASITPVTSQNLNDVNYIGNYWLAVGRQSTTIYSDDNITWFEGNVSPNATVSLTTVFGSSIGNANVFLTGGIGGNLFISNDVAQGWQQITSGTAANITQGAYGNGNYVFVAQGGYIGYSNSGSNGSWQSAVTSTNTTQDLWGVIASGNTGADWCAVGSRSTILRTSNVATWQAYNQEWPLNDSEYGYQNSRDTYVLVGDNGTIYRSIGNSSDFVRVDAITDENLEAVTYGLGTFVAVGGNGRSIISTDANTWTVYAIGSTETFRDITYSGANTGPMAFMAVGDAAQAWRSADGQVWSRMTLPTTSNLRCVNVAVTGNTVRTVIGGENGALLVSVDGFANSFVLISESGSETFIQANANNRVFTTTSSSLKATDTQDISVTLNGNTLVRGVDYAVTALNPNVTVVLANNTAVNSIVTIVTDMPAWNSVAYGDDKFVLVGENGTVWNGYDNASTWTEIPALTSANLTSVAYSTNISQFIAVGESAGSQQIGTQSYIATTYTAEYYPLSFVPDFTRIVPGMLVTGDYLRTNTLVTGTDYAQRQVYIDTTQYSSRSNITVTFTPTQIENVYPLEDPVSNGWRPWVTLNGDRLFYREDYTAEGSAVRVVANALPDTDVVQILGSSQNAVPDELDFKVWKDMNDNTAVYRMTELNVTETTYRVQYTDDIIYVADATKLSLPQLSQNQIGVAFVGSERLAYRYIDYDNNTISGLIRGIGGTAAQDHVVGTQVVDAAAPNIIPIAYRDRITAEQFTGDGNTRTFATATIMADIQEEVRLAVAGTEIPMRLANVVADGISSTFTATDSNMTGNSIGNILVDRYDQVMVGLNGVLLNRPNANVFFGDNSTNVFVANNVTVSNVANVIVVINNQVVVPTSISLSNSHPNVVINPAPNSNSWIHISDTYAVIDTDPVQVAFAQTPAANSIITIAADYYTVGVMPATVTLAEPPANGVTVLVGIDTSKNWYNAQGDGIRLQNQPTVAGRFLQGDV